MRMFSCLGRGLLPGCVLLLGASPAFAQQAPVAAKEKMGGTIEEVLVTARKRSENLQETPVAVTAMSGDDLRAQGILSTTELSKSVPSLQINDSTSAQIFIRGIGQRAPMARFDPSVSVYLDGIFIPRPDGQLLDTIDVDSVQVLRGPQGTLFGKNNTGGALVFTLSKPEDVASGYVEGGLGSYGENRLRAAVNMPVSEDFLTRLSVNSHRRDGFLEDRSIGDTQSIDRLSAIFQTRWLAGDSLTLDTLTFLGKIRERYPTYHCKIVNDDALFVDGLGLLWPGDTDPSSPRAYRDNCEANDRDKLPDLVTNQGDQQYQVKDQDVVLLGATADWELNADHSIKGIFGYRDAVKGGPQSNADEGGPAPFLRGIVLGDSDQESLTLELQFNGRLFDGALDYTAGLFWQDEYKNERFMVGSPLVGADSTSLAQLLAGQVPNPALIPPGGTNPPVLGALVPLATVQDFEIFGETAAAFAQVTWHITEDWELTVGGRYTEESRDSELATREADLAAVSTTLTSADPRFVPVEPSMGIHTFLGTWSQDPLSIAQDILREAYPDIIGAPLGAAKNYETSSTFKEFTPMASTSWVLPESLLENSLVDSAMVYATWSNGFKSGFHEPSGVDGLAVVEPELLENREIGFKIDALERSLRFNVALYAMTFENMQLITVSVDSANSLIVTSQNAGESTIEGGEMELTWLPTMNTLITLSYSNNNYSFVEFEDTALLPLAVAGDSVAIDRSDEEFAVSPRKTAALGVQYTLNTEVGLFTPRIDLSYKGEVYMGLDDASWDVAKRNPGLVYADDYMLVDLRLSWSNRENDLNIAAYVKNATDERYDIGAVATGESLGTYAQALGDPRFYGVEVFKRF